jgi:hypothetical protein
MQVLSRIVNRSATIAASPADADISAADRSETIARESADDAAVLQPHLRQAANQHRNADRDSERHHRTRRRFSHGEPPKLCIAKTPCHGHDSLLNMTGLFIEHSSGM